VENRNEAFHKIFLVSECRVKGTTFVADRQQFPRRQAAAGNTLLAIAAQLQAIIDVWKG
jgi:hypothetical protein